MKPDHSFIQVKDVDELAELKTEWLQSLTSPQDGMWEFFRNSGIHWSIYVDTKMIGYASIGEENQLLQFYITPKCQERAKVIFRDFIDRMNIKNGLVGTNNLNFLSTAINFVKELNVHTCLFRDSYGVNIEAKGGVLRECQVSDLEKIVNFCHYSMGAPKDWLQGYIGELVNNKEIYFFEKEGAIIGTCEVRKSNSAKGFADIGMVVSPDFRLQGYGTYLLNRARPIALEGGNIPICSCEKDNIGSLKSIHNCGFTSNYQLLMIKFN